MVNPAPAHAAPKKGRRAMIPIVAAACVAVVAILVAVGFFAGGSVDAPLPEIVPQAKVPAADRESGLGNAPGLLAAGGISVQAGEGCFLAGNDGIVYQRFDQVGSGDSTTVYSGEDAAYLNYDNGTLYFIDGAENQDGVLKGHRIMKQAVAEEDGAMKPQGSAQVIYAEAETDALMPTPTLHDLFYCDGAIHFLVDMGTDALLCRLDTKSGGEPEFWRGPTADSRILQVDKDSARLLCQGKDGEWGVAKLNAADDHVSSFNINLHTSSIACAAMEEQDVIFSAGPSSALKKVSLTGNYGEFNDVKGAVQVACLGDTIAVVPSDGGLTCVSSVTGLTHDFTQQLTEAMAVNVEEWTHLGIYGDWVFLTDYWSGIYQVNTKSGEVKYL